MWGAYFCMGAYKHDVVTVIKMGAFIHGAYLLWVSVTPDFTIPTLTPL